MRLIKPRKYEKQPEGGAKELKEDLICLFVLSFSATRLNSGCFIFIFDNWIFSQHNNKQSMMFREDGGWEQSAAKSLCAEKQVKRTRLEPLLILDF